MKGIEVKLIDSMGGDLSIVNSARTSFAKWKDEMDEKDERLVNYLGENLHITPFRHNCLQFRCTAPIFLARQLGKHQAGLTWNEASFRYLDEQIGYFEPESWRSRPDASIKQGSGAEEVVWLDRETRVGKAYRESVDKAIETYEAMLAVNVAPEMARMVLPQSMLVTWVWTGNLLAFAHVYNLRIKSNAQVEAQEFAKALAAEIPDEFKVGWKALTQ